MAAIDPLATRLQLELKHASPLIGCRFDPSGRFLFVSAQDSSVQRYDLLSGRKAAFSGHESWVRGMAFMTPKLAEARADLTKETVRSALAELVGPAFAAASRQPSPPFTLITGDYHGKLIWWAGDSDSPNAIREVPAHDGWVRALAVSPDGQLLASCGNDNQVKLWSVAEGKLLKTLPGHESHVYNVAFHPDGSRLVSGDLKGIVKDWDLKAGAVVRELDAKILNKYDPTFMADIGGVRSMAFGKNGAELACAGITNVSNAFAGVGNPLVLIFDWKQGTSRQLKPKEAFQGTAWGVEFHPAGYVIAAGGAGQGRIWLWKDGNPVSIHTVTVPSNSRDLSLHPDGTRFAVACADGTARVYSMLPGEPAKKKANEPARKKK